MAQPGVNDAFEAILSRDPLHTEGPVLDYLGGRAFRFPSGDDVAVAKLLTESCSELDHAYERFRDGIAGGPGEMAAIAQAAGVSPDDFSRLVSWGDFLQIYNDLLVIRTGEGPASETARFLAAEAQLGTDSVVLDVGCSSGRHLWGHLGGSPRMLVGLDANLMALLLGAMAWKSMGVGGVMHWVCADASEMPFKAASFTHAQSFATLNYLPIRAALLELGRVLAPGGRLVFTVEGNGLWKNFWDTAGSLRRRVNLLRGLAGNTLLGLGFDWQRGRLTRRLSRNTQYGPKTISRIVECCGFDVRRCEVLREYKGRPWIVGISARKRGEYGLTPAQSSRSPITPDETA